MNNSFDLFFKEFNKQTINFVTGVVKLRQMSNDGIIDFDFYFFSLKKGKHGLMDVRLPGY